jgi:arabinose-5-phosphate isomerase
MSSRAAVSSSSRAIEIPSEPLRMGRAIIREEAQALEALADRLSVSFERAVALLQHCAGCAIVTGMGKAGLVGQKIAATLASTGTPSHFVHPAEALHGDLGRIRDGDLVLAFSYSGETDEVVRLAAAVAARGVTVIGVTGNKRSALDELAETTIHLGPMREAGDLKLAPTTSSTAMLALGDALALVLSKQRGFAAADFAQHHPGGSLGLKLGRVEELMRKLAHCRVAFDHHTTRDVLVYAGKRGRRTGAIMLTDADGTLTGIFTDSDLARLVENRREAALDQPVVEVMTRNPAKTVAGALLGDAMDLMVTRKISELPVTDQHNRPIGIIDITDVMSLLPEELHSEQEIEDHVEGEEGPKTLPFREHGA